MTQKLLYLTASTCDFSHVDPNSVLLDSYRKNLPPGAYHTSLGDLPVDRIIQISSQFDMIRFEPRGFDLNGNIYKESLSLYQYLTRSTATACEGIEQFTDHPNINTRLDHPMLWVFGCSHSHGVGLRDHELNYGQWLSQSEYLDLPVALITKPGSSLTWSHRHLFNCQIKPQDTVIWQLTTPGRVSRFNGNHVMEVVLNCSKDRILVDCMNDEQLYFTQLSLLNTGTKFLHSIGCRFIIISICDFGKSYDYVSQYVKYPEYCSSYGLHVDYGTDGLHAGPLSHKAIAQRILNHVKSHDD